MTIYTLAGAIEPLSRGQTVAARGRGSSMTPRLVSGQVVTLEPLAAATILRPGEIVLAKVRGRLYLHLVRAVRGDQVQIANNHGRINGWTARHQVLGRAIDPV
jgi:translation initiation factor IF-1